MRKLLFVSGISIILINVTYADFGGWNWNVRLNGTNYSNSSNLGAFNQNFLKLNGGWGNTWQNSNGNNQDICHILIEYSISGGSPNSIIIDYVSQNSNGSGGIDKYHSKQDYDINISDLPQGSYTLKIDYKVYGRDFGVTCGTAGNSNEFTSSILNTQTFDFSINAPAPVTLQHFEATNSTYANRLQWSTASETNNDYFEVLYSSQGKDWQVLGMVNGAGNSNTIQEYSFVHHTPAKGKSFYRLRQVDFDGKYEYSPIRSVVSQDVRQEISIAPNPSPGIISLLHDGSLDVLDITINDVTGRLIARYDDYQAETLDLSHLSSGIYVISINAGGHVSHQRLVKE